MDSDLSLHQIVCEVPLTAFAGGELAAVLQMQACANGGSALLHASGYRLFVTGDRRRRIPWHT